jgi:hypothetical protein
VVGLLCACAYNTGLWGVCAPGVVVWRACSYIRVGEDGGVGVWVFVLECLVCVRSVNVCEYWPIYSVLLV